MSAVMFDKEALFKRHLDLASLRDRRRGVVRCIFHPDRSPSLSVDLDRKLFNCFACGAQGGVRAFVEAVGEGAPRRVSRRLSIVESPLPAARRWAAQRVRHDRDLAAEWAPWNVCGEFIRRSYRAVDQARAWATALGPEHPGTWPLLAIAARAEAEALAVETELDAILASGRVA